MDGRGNSSALSVKHMKGQRLNREASGKKTKISPPKKTREKRRSALVDDYSRLKGGKRKNFRILKNPNCGSGGVQKGLIHKCYFPPRTRKGKKTHRHHVRQRKDQKIPTRYKTGKISLTPDRKIQVATFPNYGERRNV